MSLCNETTINQRLKSGPVTFTATTRHDEPSNDKSLFPMTRLIKNGHLPRFVRPASLGRTKARRNRFDSNRLDVPSIRSFAAVHKKGAFVFCPFEFSIPARSRCFDFSTLSYFCSSRPPPVRFLINSRSRRELRVQPTNPISFKSEIIYIFLCVSELYGRLPYFHPFASS